MRLIPVKSSILATFFLLVLSVNSQPAQVRLIRSGPMDVRDWILTSTAFRNDISIMQRFEKIRPTNSLAYLYQLEVSDDDIAKLVPLVAAQKETERLFRPFRVRSKVDKDFSAALVIGQGEANAVGFLYINIQESEWTFVKRFENINGLYDNPIERHLNIYFSFQTNTVVPGLEMRRRATAEFARQNKLPLSEVPTPYLIFNPGNRANFVFSEPHSTVTKILPLRSDGTFGTVGTNVIRMEGPLRLSTDDLLFNHSNPR